MICPSGCVASSGWSEIATIVAPLISWVLVIVGWWVVSRDHNRRERRKEVRSQIEELVRVVREIERAAHQYLPTPADSNEGRFLALRIKSDLQRLALALGRLAECEGIDNDQMALMTFRQTVSGADFETGGRVPCTVDSARPVEVSAAAHALIEVLESSFRKKFE